MLEDKRDGADSENFRVGPDTCMYDDIAPTSKWSDMDSGEHAVQFYGVDEHLVLSVARYVVAGLEANETCIVAATRDHLYLIETMIEAYGADLRQARFSGHYIPLEAIETLSNVMVDGMPETEAFSTYIGGIIGKALDGGGKVRVFGELVAELIAQGNGHGCLRLEQLWNELQHQYSFSLLCAYPTNGFSKARLSGAVANVCHEHARVIPDESYTTIPSPAERLKEIALLQQRNAELKAELERLNREIPIAA